MKLALGLITTYKPWRAEPFAKKKPIAHIITETLKAIPAFQKIKTVEIAVLLTDNDKMQSLNNEFRDKNSPTNVLSFPDTEIKPQDLLEFVNSKEYIYIGDIAVGYDIIKQEAMDAGISLQDHFTHLIVHGVLHLIGYDHMNDKDADEMMNLEVKILQGLGIDNPY